MQNMDSSHWQVHYIYAIILISQEQCGFDMVVTVRQLMRRAHSAFRSGNIADIETLKDAMVWLNFQNSVSDRHSIADSFHRLGQDELSKLPSTPARSDSSDDYCRGICSSGVSRFHLVDILSREASADLPNMISRSNQAPFKQSLMRLAENRIKNMRRAVLWLAELDEKRFENFQPLDLLSGLGQYGRVLKPKDRVIIYTIEVEQVYKPTMIDAGYAFFWLAWQDAEPHGMTLGLNDGRPTYKEWVVPKNGVKVVDAWYLMPGEGSLTEENLQATYWDACRQRVLDRRNFAEGRA